MQLLDAALAFVLTMAALATVVTVMMESCIRMARIRKKNFIHTMRLLARELDLKALGMDGEALWKFLVRVIQPPSTPTHQKIKGSHSELSDIDRKMAALGPDRARGTSLPVRLWNLICQIPGDAKREALNDTASLEHLLRCLADTPAVKTTILNARDRVDVEFNRIARKYEEISAGISIGFKRHTQAWTMIVGIVFAIACNINGLTIFETFLLDPELAQTVITTYDTSENGPDNAGSTPLSPAPENDLSMDAARDRLAELKAMGIPMGWHTGRTLAPLSTTEMSQPVQWMFNCVLPWVFKTFIPWLFPVALTGALIGLGAPFWFDVAKRLSQIRKGIQNDAASKEFRFSSENANGNPAKRREIVTRVLTDAAREAQLSETEKDTHKVQS
ncbi:MAG: hypothetical protein V6Z89_07850 [Desulfobacter sp.]